MGNFDFSKVEFEEVKCFFCGDKTPLKILFKVPDRLNNKPGIFTLVRCQKCGLVFQNPRPKEKYIQYYYPDCWYPTGETSVLTFNNIDTEILINFYGYKNLGSPNIFKKIFLYPIYNYYFRSQSIPHYVKKGKLLEIGCSTGSRLKAMQKIGWDVEGVELDKKACAYARKKHKLNIKCASIFEVDYPPSSFDAIIMDMVLEHLYNPFLALKKITHWLKKDGQLIFSGPYFGGLEYHLFRHYCYFLALPTHIAFLNKKIISDLLKDDFKQIRFVFRNADQDITISAQYKYKDTHNFIYKLIGYNKIIRCMLIKPIVHIASLLSKTSRVTVFAIKK